MKAIFKRELFSYFMMPTGYIFIFIFLSLSSLIFNLNNLATLSSDLSSFFSMMSYVWMLLTPILVMRLIAGERKNKTDQLMFTAPVRMMDIVLGKYFAACLVLIISILFSLIYPLLVAVQGKIFLAEIAVYYIGYTLQGCAFIAFDFMISCLSKNTMTAALSTFGSNLFLWLASIAMAGSTKPFIQAINKYSNLYERFTPFLSGQLSIANLVYFMVFCGVCLFAASQILSSRRWNERS